MCDALIYAASRGHEAVIQLAQLGANIKAADQNGCTALMHAVQRRHQKAAKILLSATKHSSNATAKELL